MKRKRKKAAQHTDWKTEGGAHVRTRQTSLQEYGAKIRAEGIARRNEQTRQKAIAAAKVLLGRKIVL